VAAANHPDPGYDSGGGRLVAVQIPGRQGRKLEEGAFRVKQRSNALARQELATFLIPYAGEFRAALAHLLDPGTKLGHGCRHRFPVALELGKVCRAGAEETRPRG
jgi:hypothetical protein